MNDEIGLLRIILIRLLQTEDELTEIENTGELYKLTERTRTKFRRARMALEIAEDYITRQIKSSS